MSPSAPTVARPAPRPTLRRALRAAACASMVLVIAACGGGGSEPPIGGLGGTPLTSRAEAARFLSQATFGPTEAEISRLLALGSYEAWIDEQFARQPISGNTVLAQWDARSAALAEEGSRVSNDDPDSLLSAFYRRALDDSGTNTQLRDRLAYALSQIFVVSVRDSTLAHHPRMVASYYDMLFSKGVTSYRELLEAVTLHPAMGIYLSHRGNHGEDSLYPSRVPDQNFAREVMQLFSVGLYRLDNEGNVLLVNGQPQETYGPADIKGMSRIFTGWSWAYRDPADENAVPSFSANPNPAPADADECRTEGMVAFYDDPANTDSIYFFSGRQQTTEDRDDPVLVYAMQPYNCYHSALDRSVPSLGLSLPALAGGTSLGTTRIYDDLKVALDALATHHNTRYFIARQLIQRMVTSNPSSAYVTRVAAVFTATSGDMKSIVKAILLDPEARAMSKMAEPTFGKVREPVLRLTALLRLGGATSTSGEMLVGVTDDAAGFLGQTPLNSPSVFNFYRPGYVPPGTGVSRTVMVPGSASRQQVNMVAPEMQLATESSINGYANYIQVGLMFGFGLGQADLAGGPNDLLREVYMPFSDLSNISGGGTRPARSALLGSRLYALASIGTPADMANYLSEMWLGGAMSDALKADIAEGMNAYLATETAPNGDPDWRQKRRIQAALLLTMISPEFLVQK